MTPGNFPAPVERNSEAWHRIWAALELALKTTSLPTDGGGRRQCCLDDFMLMGLDSSGTAHFKNIVTRHYLYIDRDGRLKVPADRIFLACA
jgi:hypothetical protein